MELFLGILLLVMSIFLVVAVLFQQGKSHRLPGSIAGGAETFFGKSKSKGINSILSKLTAIVAIVFVIVVIVVYVLISKSAAVAPSTTPTGDDEIVASGADVETPVEGGEETPVEGGEEAPAEGGEEAPVEGGEETPAETEDEQ